MSVTVLDSDSACACIGAAFRRARSGPERDLVEWYLEALPITIPDGCRATIFREPRLASGYPDLVVVIWCVATASRWSHERAALLSRDLQLLQFLHQVPNAGMTLLRTLFGKSVNSSLDRLCAADLVQKAFDSWEPSPIVDSFAARRIIAIEAKVAEWPAALSQAVLNRWFASESYVLLPHVPRGDRLLQAAKPLGIGVCTREGSLVRAPRRRNGALPVSYASWLLHEWTWRAHCVVSRGA